MWQGVRFDLLPTNLKGCITMPAWNDISHAAVADRLLDNVSSITISHDAALATELAAIASASLTHHDKRNIYKLSKYWVID